MADREHNDTKQFLTFTLRDEHFAVEISKVREVLDVTTLTKIPRMPDYLCGVINLRGSVVPVIDLGYRLGMPEVEKTVNTCIMIVEVVTDNQEEPIMMGVLTDTVQEVLDLKSDEIEPCPTMGTNLNTDFIKGMGRQGENFLILLNIDLVVKEDQDITLNEFPSASSNKTHGNTEDNDATS